MEGSGIATAFVSGGIGYVQVLAPAFVGAGGITVTGTWPNITFTGSGGGGGAGTVTSVAVGAGLTLTGTPSVNPTISITATGVVAGNYGGVDINARGQIVSVPATFNPVSIITAGVGVVLGRVADNVTISMATGAVGVKGAVELVDPTDPYNPLIDNQVLTPAALAVALSSISSASAVGANNYTGEADASYTTAIGGSALSIELAAGKKALVFAEVTMVDGTTPLTPVAFGMAIFNATPTRIKADRKITQSKQNMAFLIEGPITATTWSIVTTAIPAGASVVSYSLAIQKLP
jgi:hypothetical protein